jgi:predicted secreted hydrolase
MRSRGRAVEMCVLAAAVAVAWGVRAGRTGALATATATPTATATATPTTTATATPTATATTTTTTTATATATATATVSAAATSTPTTPTWLPADPAHRWSFPRDDWAHPALRNEWWYFTGIATAVDDPSRRFGFQLTFFRIGLLPTPPAIDSAWATGQAVMAHAAVTDVARGEHVFSEVLWRAMPLLGGFGAPPDPVLAWAHAPAGTDARWSVALDRDAFRAAMRDDARGIALDLVLRPEKPVALQGPNGYSRKAAADGYASLYFSYTRLATEGTVTAGGRAFRVRGESWMDKEMGSSQLAPSQVGWDWWSLRLADGRDLMLYALRRADGSADWRNGTLVGRDGKVRLLAAGDWSAQPLGTWRSPSGATYPSGWRIALPGEGLALTVEPLVRSAENRSSLAGGVSYWEGPVRVTGARGEPVGEGYVELTGYGAGSRPPI